jgi:uncharacterized membrane protein
MVIHFPIAFFVGIGVYEIFRFMHSGGHTKEISFTSKLGLAAGTVFAIIAGTAGYFGSLAFSENYWLYYHRMFGVATVISSLAVCGMVFGTKKYMPKFIAILLLALLTSITAHLGGMFVYGPFMSSTQGR